MFATFSTVTARRMIELDQWVVTNSAATSATGRPRQEHGCSGAGEVTRTAWALQNVVQQGVHDLVLAEQLQVRAVQHELDWACAGPDTRLAFCKCPAAAAQRAVVRNGQRQPEQAQRAGRERLGLVRAGWNSNRSVRSPLRRRPVPYAGPFVTW